MDPNRASTDLDLSDVRVLSNHLPTKHLDVELRAAFGIRGPDDVFDCFYVHDGGLAVRLHGSSSLWASQDERSITAL